MQYQYRGCRVEGEEITQDWGSKDRTNTRPLSKENVRPERTTYTMTYVLFL